MKAHSTIRAALLLAILLGAAAVPPCAAAASFDHGSIETHRTLSMLIARGLASSPTFRSLFEAIQRSPAVGLRILPRFGDGSQIRAHSDLSIAFAKGDDGTSSRVPVSLRGTVFIPPDKGDIAKIGLIAHELAHVLARLGPDADPIDHDRDEQSALAIERQVIAEVETHGRTGEVRPIPASRVSPPGSRTGPGENPWYERSPR
jgi:hypothetical protein